MSPSFPEYFFLEWQVKTILYFSIINFIYISDFKLTNLPYRCELGTKNVDQPKFIVFFGMLMQFFQQFCFNCKEDSPEVTIKQTRSMATVIQTCKKCKNEFKWRSQPLVLGSIPAGNLMFWDFNLMFLMFNHMGLAAKTIRTFLRHQRQFLTQSVLLQWERHRDSLIEKIKSIKDAEWSGDGRFDSMGHSAKYGSYTMFCNSMSKLVHFEVVQVLFNKIYTYI